MEMSSKSPLNSPSSHGSSTTTTTSCSNHPPMPITRSDPNSPYPTTFVTADTTSFKQVVQMLTGSPETSKNPPKQQHHHHQQQQPDPKNFVIPPIKTAPKKQGFKLYERRNSLKNMISPLTANFAAHQHASFSPRNQQQHNHHTHSPNHYNHSHSPNHYNHNNYNHNNNYNYNYNMPEILSPSLLDFPSLTLSPVTPLVEDPFDKSSPSINGGGSSSEEEKAIAEKGFYFHPSPVSTPRDSEPQLLPLFPLSSPRVSDP